MFGCVIFQGYQVQQISYFMAHFTFVLKYTFSSLSDAGTLISFVSNGVGAKLGQEKDQGKYMSTVQVLALFLQNLPKLCCFLSLRSLYLKMFKTQSTKTTRSAV